MTVRLHIFGSVGGKGRPRASVVNGKPRLRTPEATRSAEDRVRFAWAQAGSVSLGDVPLRVRIYLMEARPTSHWRVHGGLSKLGERTPHPARRPDVDNVSKLVLDSLNGCLYADDKQVVDLHVIRRWLDVRGEQSHALVEVWPA